MANWTRRDFFRIGAVGGAAVVGGPALLTACSKVPEAGEGDTLQRIKDAGTIKVGIAGEVPYGFTENGEVTGEAPEVAKAVFKAMGVDDVEATQVEFSQLIPALNAGQYDMVAAGMAILPDRCKNAQFSAVDYVTPTALLVPKGNPQHALLKEIASTTDITFLCVTHEMNFARDVSDRVMMLDRGQIIEDAPPDKLFAQPDHDRTREFLRAVLERG